MSRCLNWPNGVFRQQTYSGFYQQEIQSHLVDAELMFKEMGYRRQSNGTLLLKGTPCLDQVANVSRDALVAYVECQLMSEIHAGLVRLRFASQPPSRAKIFAMREQIRGDVQQTIDAIVDQPPTIGCVKHHTDVDVVTSATESAHGERVSFGVGMYPTNSSDATNCPQHGQRIYANCGAVSGFLSDRIQPEVICARSGQFQNCSRSPSNFSSLHHHSATISHSHSLDQYVEQKPRPGDHESKRHSSSFDQVGHRNSNSDGMHDFMLQQPAQPSAMLQSYNVSGIRYPHNASGSTQYAAQTCVGQRSCEKLHWDHAASQSHNHTYTRHAYATTGIGIDLCSEAAATGAACSNNTIRTHPPHIAHDADALKLSTSSVRQVRPDIAHTTGDSHHHAVDHADQIFIRYNQQSHLRASLLPISIDQHYANNHRHHQQPSKQQKPYRTMNTGSRRSIAQHADPSEAVLYDGEEYDDREDLANGSRTTSRDISDFDSTDDQQAIGHHNHNSSSSGMYASKCSDGIGSFDSWNYVYTKLEKEGYNKDFGERGDLLHTEDLNRMRSISKHANSIASLEKNKLTKEVMQRRLGAGTPADTVVEPNRVMDATHQRVNGNGTGHKSKETPPSMATTFNEAQPLAIKSTPHHPTLIRRNRSPAAITEWSCEHCTLLNPMSVRICAVCARSKNLVGSTTRSTKATTTCV